MQGCSARGWPTVVLAVVFAAGWLVAGCGGPSAPAQPRCGPIQFVPGQASEPKVVVVLLDGLTSQERGGTLYPVPVAHPKPGIPVVSNYCPLDPNGNERSESTGWPRGLSDGLRRWSEFAVYWDTSNGSSPPPATLACEDQQRASAGTGGGSVEVDGALHHNQDRGVCLVARLADAGAVLLPYSYNGATLSQQQAGPVFDFHTYSSETTAQVPSFSVQWLDDELFSIHQVWPQAHLVVVGHSLGGLIAQQWWRCMVGRCDVPLDHAPAGDARGVMQVFSLDSPLNGFKMTSCDERDPLFQGYTQRLGQPIAALACQLWLGQTQLDRETLALESTASVLYTPIGVPDDPAYSNAYGDFGNIQSQVLYRTGCDHADRGCIAQPPSYVLGAPNAPECIASADIYGTTGHDLVKVCPQVVTFIVCSVQTARDNGNQQDCYPPSSSPTPPSKP